MADPNVPIADFFLDALFGVITKTSAFLRTQSPRYQKLWQEFYIQWDQVPQNIRLVPVNKHNFYNDLQYRVETLRTWENSLVEGFYAIKRILTTTYSKILPDVENLKSFFAPEDIKLLGYRIADKIIAVLQRMISLTPKDVPIKFIIVAKTRALLKLSPVKDFEIVKNITAARIPCELEEVRKTFFELERAELVHVNREGLDGEIYSNLKDFSLSPLGERFFTQKILPLLEWAIQLWQSFYNVRELDVKIPDNYLWKSHIELIVLKAATQGFSNAYFVVKNIATYYEAIQAHQENPPALN